MFCDEEDQVVRWSAADPDADWSDGWQMVIDDDNRSVFQPGTIVTNNGGPAVALETVGNGRHTLTIDVHWERLGTGTQDRGFGTFSVSVTANLKCDD